MSKPLNIWPVVRADSDVNACFKDHSCVEQAFSSSPDIFGFQVQAVYTRGSAPILTKKILWLMDDSGVLRPFTRDELVGAQKEAILQYVDLSAGSTLQRMMSALPAIIETEQDPELHSITATLVPDGIILTRDAVRRAGRNAEWEKAFRAEEEEGPDELAEICDLDLGLRMSGQAATLLIREEPAGSMHSEICRIPRLRHALSLHLARLSNLMPDSMPFRLHPNWRPPRN